jgi:hypothetical protein
MSPRRCRQRRCKQRLYDQFREHPRESLRSQRQIQDVHGHDPIVEIVERPGIGKFGAVGISKFVDPAIHTEIFEARGGAASLSAEILFALAVAGTSQRQCLRGIDPVNRFDVQHGSHGVDEDIEVGDAAAEGECFDTVEGKRITGQVGELRQGFEDKSSIVREGAEFISASSHNVEECSVIAGRQGLRSPTIDDVLQEAEMHKRRRQGITPSQRIQIAGGLAESLRDADQKAVGRSAGRKQQNHGSLQRALLRGKNSQPPRCLAHTREGQTVVHRVLAEGTGIDHCDRGNDLADQMIRCIHPDDFLIDGSDRDIAVGWIRHAPPPKRAKIIARY